jgi:hypothetical protein
VRMDIQALAAVKAKAYESLGRHTGIATRASPACRLGFRKSIGSGTSRRKCR